MQSGNDFSVMIGFFPSKSIKETPTLKVTNQSSIHTGHGKAKTIFLHFSRITELTPRTVQPNN